jgi:hypothetical protein
MSEVHQKRQKKVSSNLEEVEEVVWAFALSPRWQFAWVAALGVVVVFSCFHRVHFYIIGNITKSLFQDLHKTGT